MKNKAMMAVVAIGMIITNQFQCFAALPVSGSLNFTSRLKRAADQNYVDFAEKMGKTARIIDGVTLYNEILDGTSSRTIGKFLGLPSIGFEEIQKFQSLDFPSKLLNLENQFVNYHSGPMGPILNRLNQLHDLVKVPIDWSTLPSSLDALDPLLTIDIDALKSFDIDDVLDKLSNNDDLDSVSAKLTDCQVALQNVQALDFAGITALLKSLEPLKTYKERFSMVFTVKRLKGASDQDIDQFKVNLGIANRVLNSQDVDGFLTLYEVYTALTSTKHSELQNLLPLVDEPWFQAAVGDVNLQGLQAIESFAGTLGQLNNKWSTTLDSNLMGKTRNGISLYNMVKTTPQFALADWDTLLGSIKNCPVPDSSNDLETRMQILSPNFLLKKMNALKAISDAGLKMLPSQPSQDDVDSVTAQLKQLKLHFIVLGLSNADFQGIAQRLKNEENLIQGIQQNAFFLEYEAMFNCVGALPMGTVKETAAFITGLYQYDRNFIDDMKSITTNFLQSTQEIQAIATTLTAIQQAPDNDIPKLKPIAPDAFVFQEAVKALTAIHEAYGKSNSFQDFVSLGGVIESELYRETVDYVFNKNVRNWGDFAVESGKVQQLIQDLTSRVDAAPVPPAAPNDKLVDYSPLFTRLDGLQDVPGFGAKKEVCEGVSRTPPQLLHAVSELAQLDLEFSKFTGPLANMQMTLTNIHNGFQLILKGLTPATLPPPPTPVTQPPATQPTQPPISRTTVLKKKKKKSRKTTKSTDNDGLNKVGAEAQKSEKTVAEENEYLAPMLIGFGALLFVVCVGVGVYVIYSNHKKESGTKLTKLKKGKKGKKESGSEPVDSGDDLARSPTVAKLSKELVDPSPNDPLKSPPADEDVGSKEQDKEKKGRSKEPVWV